jgi:CheY-like chemotaxis protein
VDNALRPVDRAFDPVAETVKRLLVFARAQPEGEPESVELGTLLSDAAKLTAAAPPRLRILAVDDEPELRDMVALMLGNDGHAVRTVASGDEALAALEAGEFDLVLSDVGMSGMNGWELVERVRRRWPSLRLVLATGWGAEIDPARARQQGIEAVIAKPFRFNDLRRVLAGGR